MQMQQQATKSNEKAKKNIGNCHLSLLFITFTMFFLWFLIFL